jgi:TonB family protein
VRAKIWKVNERIMPRHWIERMLDRKVSADFNVLLANGGQVRSTRLVRSSGFSTLDEIARQAINTASPFEGFPPEAGDTLSLVVTVYYTPYR